MTISSLFLTPVYADATSEVVLTSLSVIPSVWFVKIFYVVGLLVVAGFALHFIKRYIR